jgi:predicted ribosome quality control (RQC) complex YloA/Tae2 family protein
MDDTFLAAITGEVAEVVVGKRVSAIHHSGHWLTFDFGLPDRRVLLVSLDLSCPGLFIASKIQRKPARTLQPTAFARQLAAKLTGARLCFLKKVAADRILIGEFNREDDEGLTARKVVFFLTGRSSDVHLLSRSGDVEAMATGRTKPCVGLALIEQSSVVGDASNRSEAYFNLDGVLVGGASDKRTRYGRMLTDELDARKMSSGAVEAEASLLSDLAEPPIGLVFASLPLQEAGRTLMSPDTDLLLSRVELQQAAKMRRYEFGSLSEAAEAYYDARRRAAEFQQRLSVLKQRVGAELKKTRSALKSAEGDLLRYQAPERYKRSGDLLLANINSATVAGGKATVVDYFNPDQPDVEIDLLECASIQAAATSYYGLYKKGCRSLATISARKLTLERREASLASFMTALSESPARETVDQVTERAAQWLGLPARERPPKQAVRPELERVGRRFVSSDGYEILVGRGDRENDLITFRLAGSRDLWMHAADYPGSHVVIRNPRRQEIPATTLRQAAQLAAFYSQARRETKAAVHYTEKKFVSKPPKAKPGLVRLSAYKTILVQPRRDTPRESGGAEDS